VRKPMDRYIPKDALLFNNALAIYIKVKRNLTKSLVVLVLCLIFSFAILVPQKSYALCGPTCLSKVKSMDPWNKTQNVLDEHINDEFMELEDYILRMIWMENVLPALMLATEQLSAVAMQQALHIGMFIDAEVQLSSQRLLQEIRAQTHKDFRPSQSLCEFGTLTKSLANADIHSNTYAVIFSERSQDRQLGKGDTAGNYGHDLDQNNRILHFKRLFCNQKERASALETVCDNTTSWTNAAFDADARYRMNKDIDYFLLVDKPSTLRINFSNQRLQDITAVPEIHDEDEEHILAMVANLFGHVTFARPPARLLANKPDVKTLTTMQKLYLDMRAVVAKRSVAENSLFSIASMKAQGPRTPMIYTDGLATTELSYPRARDFMIAALSEMGFPAIDLLQYLGENPSYYSQMEFLTKIIYQHPKFYTELYDTPANVERKTVALQAVKLMQKFDMLKSHLRGEMNVSILLEMAVEQLQREVENQIQGLER